MPSLVHFYQHDGTFIDRYLLPVSIGKDITSMESATLTFNVGTSRLSEDMLRPGNFVTIQDKLLTNMWAGLTVPPISVNAQQVVVGLTDPKYLLTGIPILNVEGLDATVLASTGISFAINSTSAQQRHMFRYSLTENIFASDTPLGKNSIEHLGKDIYSFLNEIANSKNMEWWLEPIISQTGLLTFNIRTAIIRKTIGLPIYVPKKASIAGLGLTYSNKYYTTLIVIDSRGAYPKYIKTIEFPGLVEHFGSVAKTIELREIENSEYSVGRLFKKLRPRRTVQINVQADQTQLIKSIELGSVHLVYLGNIGFIGTRKGTILPMRTIGLSFSSEENILGIVLEEYFTTDENAILKI